MKIFSKELNLKNYYCSKDNIRYIKTNTPIINLYVQITGKCNAKCKFCNLENIYEDFNFEKFDYILHTLSQNIIIGKVAITGGEPLLNVPKTRRVIKIARKYSNVVTLNTNSFSIDALNKIYDLVDYIDISKHYFNNNVNDRMMNLKTPNLQAISDVDKKSKISINCVMQKGFIDSYLNVIEFLEYIGKYNIKSVKFISLLPLNESAKENYIDPTSIMQKCKHFTNSGMLYDYDMCHCFEFLYLSTSCTTVKVIIKHTTNSDYSCIKQFVFNGKYLYDGFKKNNIIY